MSAYLRHWSSDQNFTSFIRKDFLITFFFLNLEIDFHHIVKATLERLESGDPPDSASWVSKAAGRCHCSHFYFSYITNLPY